MTTFVLGVYTTILICIENRKVIEPRLLTGYLFGMEFQLKEFNKTKKEFDNIQSVLIQYSVKTDCVFSTHPISGMTVPISIFLVVIRKLYDYEDIGMGKVKGKIGPAELLSELRAVRNNLFPVAVPFSFHLPDSLLSTHIPQPFMAVDR